MPESVTVTAARVPSAVVPVGLEFALTVAVGVISGVLSGMFGIGGAVVTTPAIRVLGATTFQAIGSTLPSILPSSISGSLRYRREQLHPPAGRGRSPRPSACPRRWSAPASPARCRGTATC